LAVAATARLPPVGGASTATIEKVREIFDEVRKDICGALESQKLQFPIDKVYPFDEIGQAFEHMEANRHLGKIVVTM
jgi:NADPH:quinone reductase